MKSGIRLLLSMLVSLAAMASEPIQVFAASSLEPALDEVLSGWKASDGTQARATYAASSLLARQIEQGAAADLFLSADERWMDELQKQGLVNTASRQDLLGNHLVLIAPAGHAFVVSFTTTFDIIAAFPGHLATTDPAVPLGQYAQEAFVALGWNTILAPRLLPAENAKAALRLVELGEVDAGVAYASEVLKDTRVSVIGVFPDSLHSSIRYPVAKMVASQPQAAALLDYLQDHAAQAIFRRHGLIVLTATSR